MKNIYAQYMTYAYTAWALIKADLLVFKSNFHNRLLDTTISLIANLIVSAYILPQFGLTANFGPFMLGGLMMSTIVFESYPFVATLVNDISGDKKIVSYLCSLPLPTWLAFAQTIISLALRSFILATCMFVVGKLFLGDQLPLTQPSYVALFLMLAFTSIFSATLALWLASVIKNAALISSAWTRFLFPLWIFGGFQFSWAALHGAFPRASYINLLNPLLYGTEGVRNALNVAGTFLPIWLCISALTFFTALCGWRGIKRLKRRLDFI